MKNFIKYDYYTQIIVAVCFFIILILDITVLEKGYGFIAYFVLAASHTISFLTRIFSKQYTQNTEFKIYSRTSLIVLGLLLMVLLFHDINWIMDFVGYILMVGILITPLLAIWYLNIVCWDYKESNIQNS